MSDTVQSRARLLMRLNEWNRENALVMCLGDGEPCARPAIRSHSIQCAHVLRNLAMQGHVYMFRRKPDGSLRLDRVGVKLATTFTGFCSEHDTSIFREIDFDASRSFNSESRRQLLLLAFRAVAREYWTILNAARFHAEMASLARARDLAGIMELLDCDQGSAETVVGNADLLAGWARGRRWSRGRSERAFRSIASQLSTGRDHLMVHRTFQFPGRSGFAAAAVVTPWGDMNGTQLNALATDRDAADLILNAFPSGGSLWVVLTFHRRHQSRLGRLVDQLAALPIDVREVAISRIVVGEVENVVIAPAVVEALSPEERAQLETAHQRTVLEPAVYHELPETNFFAGP